VHLFFKTPFKPKAPFSNNIAYLYSNEELKNTFQFHHFSLYTLTTTFYEAREDRLKEVQVFQKIERKKIIWVVFTFF
jgi:hypothetical protein